MNSTLIGQFVIFENNYRHGKNVIRLKGTEPAMAASGIDGLTYAIKRARHPLKVSTPR